MKPFIMIIKQSPEKQSYDQVDDQYMDYYKHNKVKDRGVY